MTVAIPTKPHVVHIIRYIGTRYTAAICKIVVRVVTRGLPTIHNIIIIRR